MTRVLLFLLMGIGIVGFVLFGWRALHQPPPPSPVVAVAKVEPVMLKLVSAMRDLTPGTFLRPGDLSSVSVAQAAMPPGAMIDTPTARASLVGALVRKPILHDAVLDPATLLLAGEHGFLAAILLPGLRAFTIPPDQIVSNAGLVWPGDRVDLILTQQMPSSMPPDRQISAETVLTDLRVLAIDRQLIRPQPDEATSHGDAGNGAATAEAVTVEVSPTDAERLAVALRLGKVVLSLRADGPASPDTHPTETVWAGGVLHALTEIQPPPASRSVHVFNGMEDKEYKY